MGMDESVTMENGVCQIVARRHVMSRPLLMGIALLIFMPVVLMVLGMTLSVFDIGFMGENAFTLGVTAASVLAAAIIALVVTRAAFGEPGRLRHVTASINEDGLQVDGQRAVSLRKFKTIEVIDTGSDIPLHAKIGILPMLLIWLLFRGSLGRFLPHVIAGPVASNIWAVRVGPRRVPAHFLKQETALELAAILTRQAEAARAITEPATGPAARATA